MKIDFKNINYLKVGNSKQKEVYRIIREHKLLEILKEYNPIIVGTIPINIHTNQSDIDIILQTNNFEKLKDFLHQKFSSFQNFQIEFLEDNILMCNFNLENVPFELYAKNQKTEMQNGYLHMVKEYEILQSKDNDFAEEIRNLKKKGIKTEPAFCQLLRIKGDPYIELLKYEVK